MQEGHRSAHPKGTGAEPSTDPRSRPISFRRLTDADLPMMHRWLNEPGIVRWWEGDDVSVAGVVNDYGSAKRDQTEHWIARLEGRDFGWIQCYGITESAKEMQLWTPLGVRQTAAGIDYLIGEPANRGCGLGSAMIRRFVNEVVFGLHQEWDQACAAPSVDNVASWRALEKAEFRLLGTVEDSTGLCRLMAFDRPYPA